MTKIPSEFMKDYKDNFKRLGHSGALQIVRSRITFSPRYGHAWYMAHRKEIEAELAKIESRVKP